ncbi:hypothetical protein HRG84_07825 [Flavisolibacter sp. BT320]|nr:hypothetical protein [Flavisolibacter longurius]
MARKTSLGSLLLAGAAAYGLYKVSKMSPEQRKDLVNRGKRTVTENLDGLKNKFGRNGSSPDAHISTVANDVTYGG